MQPSPKANVDATQWMKNVEERLEALSKTVVRDISTAFEGFKAAEEEVFRRVAQESAAARSKAQSRPVPETGPLSDGDVKRIADEVCRRLEPFLKETARRVGEEVRQQGILSTIPGEQGTHVDASHADASPPPVQAAAVHNSDEAMRAIARQAQTRKAIQRWMWAWLKGNRLQRIAAAVIIVVVAASLWRWWSSSGRASPVPSPMTAETSRQAPAKQVPASVEQDAAPKSDALETAFAGLDSSMKEWDRQIREQNSRVSRELAKVADTFKDDKSKRRVTRAAHAYVTASHRGEPAGAEDEYVLSIAAIQGFFGLSQDGAMSWWEPTKLTGQTSAALVSYLNEKLLPKWGVREENGATPVERLARDSRAGDFEKLRQKLARAALLEIVTGPTR